MVSLVLKFLLVFFWFLFQALKGLICFFGALTLASHIDI